jgi:hypothetical protein
MCEDFSPNFGDKRTARCITTMHHLTLFFTREFFTKNNMIVFPYPPYFSLLPQLKIKLKDRHLDTNEVIEAESQAVLNTLREKDLIYKMAEMLGSLHTRGMELLRGWLPVGPKL